MKFSVSLFCLLALSGLLQGCSGNDGNECQGYVEGEYVYLSSARAGRLEKLLTRKGSSVESGMLLASLESEYERQAVAKSERSLAQTRALYNDMLTGKRPAEVSMAKAQLAKARADQANASAELARVEALYRQNAVSKKELDNQRAVSRSADATVVEMQKQVDVYNLPEREQRIAAQKAAVEADEAALAQARWELGQKEIRPSQAGLVYDTLYRVGEWVPAGSPVIQLLLFGYAINNDPKHLPTAFVPGEETIFTRSVGSALRASDYFRITGVMNEEDAGNALKSGDVSFVINIPTDFTRRLLRGEKPSMLIEADATDPTATAGAIGAVQGIVESVLKRDMKGPLSSLAPVSQSFSITAHKMYNPEGLTRLNIVPGLIGVILALMTCMLTSMALTRERERGNMENLLASPVTPVEIMLGKITPYIVTGHIQVGIVLALAVFLFKVPFTGDPAALYAASVLFIAANLTVGVTISAVARNQLQAMQMTFFYFLPNIMLSGFMFPFYGMPEWAQYIGSVLPLTYFNRLVRGILLKGCGWQDIWQNLWPIAAFTAALMGVAVRAFRRTLD